LIISIWRYCHLALAISASVFILLLSITGVFLALDPIEAKLESNVSVDKYPYLTLGEELNMLTESYPNIIDLKKDKNGFLLVSIIEDSGDLLEFYVHPLTAEKTGDKRERSALIKFMTNLHRSLFLKSVGRFFIGLSSFFLFLIAITGLVLLVKRQQGIKHLFKKVIKENFFQFNHVYLSRIAFIPIVLVAASGVYLSLLRFSVIPDRSLDHDPNFNLVKEAPIIELFSEGIFSQIPLIEIRSVEFPFSENVYDFFTVELQEKELQINQFTGDIVSEIHYPMVKFYNEWMAFLHTGEGSASWSFALLLTALTIPFLTVTGFRMTLKRRAHKLANEYDARESEYVILVGSETGTTMGFAKVFYKKLLSTGAKAYIGQMNEVQAYPSMKQLLIFTATFGQGEAPTNAAKFKRKLKASLQDQEFGFSIVGFGSTAYPEFCKYAFDVEKWMARISGAHQEKLTHTVNNKSWCSFKQWALEWGTKFNLNLTLPEELSAELAAIERYKFSVVNKRSHGENFLLEIKSESALSVQSGDLIAVPASDSTHDRLYSIGTGKNGNLLIAVKKYKDGVCSTYLDQLSINAQFNASLISNKDFHLPEHADSIIMVSAGAGIAPFLGMIGSSNASQKIHLFWGGKTRKGFKKLYAPFINSPEVADHIESVELAFSKEPGEKKKYVQELLSENFKRIESALLGNGVLMICGSIKMRDGVFDQLKVLFNEGGNLSLDELKKNGKIVTDCY